MKVNVENLSSTERKIQVAIPAEEVKSQRDEVFDEVSKNAKIKGFRPGKAPKNVVEAMYKDHIIEELTSRLVSGSFEDALKEASVSPINRPQITPQAIDPEKEFEYSAVFEVIPEFELEDYKGLELEKEKYEVKDEDVDKALEHLRQHRAETKPLEEEREIKVGDIAIIDFDGQIDGVTVEGLKKSDIPFVVGEDKLIPEFEENILGMKKGDEKEFDVSYDEDFQISEAAGKTVKFTLKLTDIRERILPELTDDFATELGEENLDSLNAKIRDDLGKQMAQQSEQNLKKSILDKIVDSNAFDTPESLVAGEAERLRESFMQNMRQQGLQINTLDTETDQKLYNTATRNVKASIVLGEIASKEGLKVDYQEIHKRLEEISSSVGVPVDQVRDIYEKNNMLPSIESGLLEAKVIDFIIENANLTEVEPDTNQIDKET